MLLLVFSSCLCCNRVRSCFGSCFLAFAFGVDFGIVGGIKVDLVKRVCGCGCMLLFRLLARVCLCVNKNGKTTSTIRKTIPSAPTTNKY